jgi:hypothetical protein
MNLIKRLFNKKVQKQCVISGFSNSYLKPNEYKVIMTNNIMVAQGYECSKCKVIRAYNQLTCNC